jgi:glyoxylase-like metal-dependent hydrolase (beta-lactamase superfamily II)
MAAPRVDVISIGTLSRNRLWGEAQAVRTAHSTTSLIRAGKRTILVDPGLPDQVDIVFLTNFRQAHRAGLQLFATAKILIHENEQQFAAEQMQALIDQAPPDDIDRRLLERDLDLVQSLSPAEDKLAPGVDLYPLFGYTPGTCGLLVSAPVLTTLIAGDAVPTLDHFLAGQVLPDSHDIAAAQESLREVYEIADLIVPGHDNLFPNPRATGL